VRADFEHPLDKTEYKVRWQKIENASV
jgi:hypothetical protein